MIYPYRRRNSPGPLCLGRPNRGAIMNINTALGAHESKEPSEVEVRQNIREIIRGQVESADVKTSADDLAALLRRLSDKPTHEIEKLIDALQALRKQLQSAGNRIQRDIAEYAELSERIMQLTAIISDSVKKLPSGIHR
jgi:uncharacterized protein (DUF3084 family)